MGPTYNDKLAPPEQIDQKREDEELVLLQLIPCSSVGDGGGQLQEMHVVNDGNGDGPGGPRRRRP